MPFSASPEWHFGFWIPETALSHRPFSLIADSANGTLMQNVALDPGEPGTGDILPLRLDRTGEGLRRHLEKRETLPAAANLAEFVPDMAKYLQQHRLIYQSPAGHWSDGLPLGNGTMGAVVTGERGKSQNFHLDRCDLWAASPDGRPFGRFFGGGLFLCFTPENDGQQGQPTNGYLQELNLHSAELTTADGPLRTTARVNALRDVLEIAIKWNGDGPLRVKLELNRPAMPLMENDLTLFEMANGSWEAVYSRARIAEAKRVVNAGPHTQPIVTRAGNMALIRHDLPNIKACLATAVEGVKTTWTNSSQTRLARAMTEFVLSPGKSATVVVALTSDRVTPDPENAAVTLLDETRVLRSKVPFNADPACDRDDEHRGWWRKFWQRSFIELPDKVMENLWYFGSYHQASFSRSLETSGFFGLWHPLDHRTWGDLHTADAQVALLWWAPFAVNHLELLLPSHNTFAGLLPYFEAFNPGKGALVPHQFAPAWAGGREYFGRANAHKGSIGWYALNFWWDYLFTRDRDFLAEIAYPVIAACADFHAADLIRGTDKKLHCLKSGAPEQNNTADDNVYDRACIGAVLRAAAEAADILKVEADRARQWRETLRNLFEFPTDAATIVETLSNPHPYRCHPVVLFGIHPTGTIEPGDPLWHKAAASYDMVTNLFAFHYEDRHVTIPGHAGGQEPNGHATAFLMHAAARLKGWREVRRIFYALAVRTQLKPNGLRSISDPRHDKHLTNMAISEATSGQTSGITETLIQNYSDHARVFSGIDADGLFRFSGLRAYGGFVLAGECLDRAVTGLTIHSLRGETLRIMNPWPGQMPTVEPATQIKPVQLADGQDGLEIPTRAGVTYHLTGGSGQKSPPAVVEARNAPRRITCGDWNDFSPPVVYYPEDLPFAQEPDGNDVFLGMPSPETRDHSVPTPSWERIRLLADSTEWPARQTAARWLCRLSSEEAEKLLVRLATEDPVAVVRYTAGVSLVNRMGPSSLHSALLIARDADRPHLRREILKAVTRLARRPEGREKLTDLFSDLKSLEDLFTTIKQNN